MNNVRICKTCKKILPVGYLGEECEYCIGKKAEKIRKGGAFGAAIGMAALSLLGILWGNGTIGKKK